MFSHAIKLTPINSIVGALAPHFVIEPNIKVYHGILLIRLTLLPIFKILIVPKVLAVYFTLIPTFSL